MVLNPIQYALKWHSSDGFGGRRWSHSDSVLPMNPSRKMRERKLKKRDRKKAPWSLEMKNDQISKFGSNLFCGSILGGSIIVLVGYLVHLQFLTCLMTDFKKFHGWSSPRLFPSFFYKWSFFSISPGLGKVVGRWFGKTPGGRSTERITNGTLQYFDAPENLFEVVGMPTVVFLPFTTEAWVCRLYWH